MGCTYCFLMKKELINLPILTSVGHKPQCIFAHVLLLWISIGLHLSIITLGESSLFVWICCDIWSLGRSESWHWWKIDVKARSQLGQLMDRSILRSSPCSFGCSMSQRLRSETVQFPSTCWIWIRYFGDDCACLSTNTLRGGTLIGASILNLLVIWPPPKLFESKSADSEDGKHRLSVGVWIISLLYGWGGFSQADWGCSKWAGLSQAESCSFLFSRNCFLRLAFLLRVEGDFFLASDGVRAEAMISFPLLSKEKENDPEVIWILKPIFWLTSAWVKAKHCVSRKWSFPITRGAAILTVRSGRDFRRAHAAPRVRLLLKKKSQPLAVDRWWPEVSFPVDFLRLIRCSRLFHRSSCSGAGWRRFLLQSFQSHFNQLQRVLHQQQIFFAPGVLSGAPSKCPSYFCRGKKVPSALAEWVSDKRAQN